MARCIVAKHPSFVHSIGVKMVHPASAYFAVKKNVEKSEFKVEIVSEF
jgi:hypothetical protein